jgi:AcrR family transcriptional regulator
MCTVSAVASEPARERMLDAAAELYDELPLDALLRGLHPGSIARRARASRTSFYACWETQQAFWADLVLHVCAGERSPRRARREQAAPVDVSAAFIRRAARDEFQAGLARGDLPLRMLLWSKSSDPMVRAELRRSYADALRPLAPRWEQLFTLWGREARPPFSIGDIATLMAALGEGLIVRHRIDPHTAPVSLFEDAVLTLVSALTREVGDRAVDQIDFVRRPARNGSTGAAAAVPATERRARSHAAILDAFERLLVDRGYHDVTIADVAERAGVSATTVYEHFGSKAQLARSLNAVAIEELGARLGALPADAELECCLVEIFDYVAARRPIFNAARSAHLEEPQALPYVGVRNPILPHLLARVDVDAVRGDARVVAALWFRTMTVAALEVDLPARPADLAHALVHGIPGRRPAGERDPARASLRA